MRIPTPPAKRALPLVFILLFIFSCGGEDPPTRNDQIIPIPDPGGDELDVGSDADTDADTDAKDTEDPCADVTCDEGSVCVEGECEALAAEGFGCAAPRDLGTLEEGSQTIQVQVPEGQPNQQATTCASQNNSPEAVFSFAVPTHSRVDFEITQWDGNVVMEVREDSCRDPEQMKFCSGASGDRLYARPDTTYYLLVEAREAYALSDFEVQLKVVEQICATPGSWSCDGDQRVLCYGGLEERAYECAAECSDSSCLGATCQNALEIRASQTLTGDLAAYESNINLSESPSCSTEGTGGPHTPGAEIILSLPELRAGQVVRIDTQNSSQPAAIGIMADCPGTKLTCLAADNTVGVLEWEVEDEGNYFAIIDPLFSGSGTFHYEIEISN